MLVALVLSITCYADVVKEGNVITITKTTTLVNEKQSTGLIYKDSKGNTYLIYKSKNNKFYVMKTSQKTGKEYKYYLPKEAQETLKKELGIQ